MFKLTSQETLKLYRKAIKPKSKSYVLGLLVGERMGEYLPTLSTDYIQSKNVIEVDKEDAIKLEWLSNQISWFKEGEDHDKQWKVYKGFMNELEDKYLPKEYIHYVGMNIPYSSLEKFKKGISCALWNSDLCAYNTGLHQIYVDVFYPLGDTRIIVKR